MNKSLEEISTTLLEHGLSPIAYVGIFLGVLLAFEGFRQILTRSESAAEVKNRRMRMIARGASTADVLRLLKPTQKVWALSGVPYIGNLPLVLHQAGVAVKPRVFLLTMISLTLAVASAATIVASVPIAIGFATVLGLALPITFVRVAARTRMSKLEKQLPDALDLMARGLIVGHPLNTTISAVATDMPDPIASNFGTIVDQIAYGDELVDAFMEFAERTEVEDVRYLAISVAIQHGTGGDLGQVLQTLAKVIRDRISMRKRVLAISSEGRLTSVFLSLLPVVIFVTTSMTSPGYYGEVADDPLFMPMATVVVALAVANFLVLRKLVDFRI